MLKHASAFIAQRRKYVDSKLTPLFRDAFSDDWEPLIGYPIIRKDESLGGRVDWPWGPCYNGPDRRSTLSWAPIHRGM